VQLTTQWLRYHSRPWHHRISSTNRVEFLFCRSRRLTIHAAVVFLWRCRIFRCSRRINRPVLMLFYYLMQWHRNRNYVQYRSYLAVTPLNINYHFCTKAVFKSLDQQRTIVSLSVTETRTQFWMMSLCSLSLANDNACLLFITAALPQEVGDIFPIFHEQTDHRL